MKRLILLTTLPLIFIGLVGCEKDKDVIPEILISKTQLYFDETEGESMISIDTKFEYNISAQSSWVAAEKVYGGIVISVESNSTLSDRSASVVVYNKKHDIEEVIQVQQRARPYKLGDIASKGDRRGVVFEVVGYDAKMISIEYSDKEFFWSDANAWCSQPSYGWRMPTKVELLKAFQLRYILNLVFDQDFWTSSPAGDSRYYYVDENGNYSGCSMNAIKKYVYAVCDL